MLIRMIKKIFEELGERSFVPGLLMYLFFAGGPMAS